MTLPATQERVRRVVAEHDRPITSKQVGAQLHISAGWASHVLSELLRAGVVSVAHVGDGSYEWSA